MSTSYNDVPVSGVSPAASTAFPVISIISIILLLAPIRPHVKAKNIGTLGFVGWLFTALLILTINSIVWHNSVRPAGVWGDISQSSCIHLPYFVELYRYTAHAGRAIWYSCVVSMYLKALGEYRIISRSIQYSCR